MSRRPLIEHGRPKVYVPFAREHEPDRWAKPLAWLLIGFAVLLLAGNAWGAA